MSMNGIEYRTMSKKELREALGFLTYEGLYAQLKRIGVKYAKGKQMFTQAELNEICEKTGLKLNS